MDLYVNLTETLLLEEGKSIKEIWEGWRKKKNEGRKGDRKKGASERIIGDEERYTAMDCSDIDMILQSIIKTLCI